MKLVTTLALLAALTLFGFAQKAQAVPNILGLDAFSPQVRYMSLAGYLRWQSFKENNVWISQSEAEALTKSQLANN